MSDNSSAAGNARSWYESICEMVEEVDIANEAADRDGALDDARQHIEESILSVEVRTGWYMPGQTPKPEEYMILLTTGGPALRLIGDLDEYGQPETARLEYQDWDPPWTEYNPGHHDDAFKPEDYDAYDSTLLAFASVFYYGE